MNPVASLFGALMLLSMMMVPALTPKTVAGPGQSVDLESLIPPVLGQWRLDTARLAAAPAVVGNNPSTLAFDQLLQRTYINANGERLMLVIGWDQRQSGLLKAHRQEICYGARGAEIRNPHQATLTLGPASLEVTRLYAVTPARKEPVTYWLLLGDRVVNSPLSWLRAQLRSGLRGEAPQGLLVRVSNLSDQPERAFHLHDSFIADLVTHLPARRRARFIGRQET